ncbi:hypothetical protein [Rhodococcus erythropolis]|jgi:hypothetical protein|nr:hypothetical protein [Rhodococcus erythropolis]MCZ4565380.1 hypothetical protein [Rhodococcus erythropolis]
MSTTARWSLVIGIGVAVTLTLGFFAALTAGDQKTLTFVVFAIVMAPACIGSVWALFPSEKNKAPAYPEDTVETEWSRKAGFGAFTDLITAMGIALIAHNVFGAPELPLLIFTALGLVDFGVRYWAVSRDRAPTIEI